MLELIERLGLLESFRVDEMLIEDRLPRASQLLQLLRHALPLLHVLCCVVDGFVLADEMVELLQLLLRSHVAKSTITRRDRKGASRKAASGNRNAFRSAKRFVCFTLAPY